MVSSEIVPFIKTGGLADVTGALPRFINNKKFNVICILPFYSSIKIDRSQITEAGIVTIPESGVCLKGGVFRTVLPGSSVTLYLLKYGPYFDRDGIYGDAEGDYNDNDRRFAFFCRGVFEICRLAAFKPDVIHCNDWQTGLIPLFMKTLYSNEPFFSSTATLYTIHNLAFHGIFDPGRVINITGLPWSIYSMYGAEFYGNFSFQKSGIYYADFINTVSRRYSEEIQSPESGMGLDGLLRSRKATLAGILNGVDYDTWDPGKDKLIKTNFDITMIAAKKENTKHLCRICGLFYDSSAPVIGMVTRLTEQKGIDLTAAIIDKLMQRDIRFVLLGTGDEYYHKIFSEFAERYKGKMYISLRYDEELSHLIYAGSDIFLIPSRFEPCGLGQIISFRYGTIPVARETGGLADTIIPCRSGEEIDTGVNGFLFRDYNSGALYETLVDALNLFADKEQWGKLIDNAMKADFSWSVSAAGYEDIYRKLCIRNEGLK